MKNTISVEELIEKKGLTPEELELHKELIKESLEREIFIEKNCKNMGKNLSMLSEAFIAISKSQIEINEGLTSFIASGKETIGKMKATKEILASNLETIKKTNKTLEGLELAMTSEEEFCKE